MLKFFLKRASIFGALFFCAHYFYASQAHASQCTPPGDITYHPVKHIYDGDTVKLSNGEKIRLIGINSPEMGKDGKPDEPFARAARDFLRDQLRSTNYRIGLMADRQDTDRFGRKLRHAFLPDGTNLTRNMLQACRSLKVAMRAGGQ